MFLGSLIAEILQISAIKASKTRKFQQLISAIMAAEGGHRVGGGRGREEEVGGGGDLVTELRFHDLSGRGGVREEAGGGGIW